MTEPLSQQVRPSDEFAAALAVAERLIANVERVIRGKREQIELVLCALLCRGHVLLEDVPGTAKTVLARAIAQSIAGSHASRIQCTPDLQPTDVTGLSIYDQRTREFEFRAGPVFANVVLVGEVNRAMPRLPRGARLRERRPRRRGDPRDAAHAVGAARGDGRAAGDGRRGHAAAAVAVPRDRDREPDRPGGNVPPPRSPARPFRPAHRARLSD